MIAIYFVNICDKGAHQGALTLLLYAVMSCAMILLVAFRIQELIVAWTTGEGILSSPYLLLIRSFWDE